MSLSAGSARAGFQLGHRLATASNWLAAGILTMGLSALSVTFLGGVPGGRSLIHAERQLHLPADDNYIAPSWER